MMTLSLKLSLLLTDSGTSVDGWFGSSWSRLTACTSRSLSGGARYTQVPRVSGTQVNPGIRYIDSCFSSHPPFKGGWLEIISIPNPPQYLVHPQAVGTPGQNLGIYSGVDFKRTCRSTSAWRPWTARAGCRWRPRSSPPRRWLPSQRPSVCWTISFVAIAQFGDAVVWSNITFIIIIIHMNIVLIVMVWLY